MERSNGIVNAKKLSISAAPALLEELINNGPKTPRPANATAPQPNHTSGTTHVHFAASLRHLHHIPKPIRVAQTTLSRLRRKGSVVGSASLSMAPRQNRYRVPRVEGC